MKPMQLAEVRKHTGRQLTYAEAVKLANPGDPFLRNMAIALSLHSWNNTAQEWLRLEAVLVIMHHRRGSGTTRSTRQRRERRAREAHRDADQALERRDAYRPAGRQQGRG